MESVALKYSMIVILLSLALSIFALLDTKMQLVFVNKYVEMEYYLFYNVMMVI